MNSLHSSIRIFLILLFVCICTISSSCSGLLQNGQNSGSNNSDAFQNAYSKYDQGQYILAISLFKDICKSDSDAHFYDSYSFIADSYNRLGNADSGIIAYESGIQKLNALRAKAPKRLTYSWYYDSLVAWKSLYPLFPAFLLKENGYVPFDSLGSAILKSPPQYPVSAREQNVQGVCWLSGVVDINGHISDITVLQSVRSDVDFASIEALKKWTFKPFKIRGRIATVEVSVPFKFSLRR